MTQNSQLVPAETPLRSWSGKLRGKGKLDLTEGSIDSGPQRRRTRAAITEGAHAFWNHHKMPRNLNNVRPC
jgi:hypothetical protein